MRVRFWGVRGSIPTPSPEMVGYGGNTACVELTLSDGTELILDAGTGIRELGRARRHGSEPVHVLLTHLHLDHIQGMMFFAPLFDQKCDVRICGPPAFGGSLINRLARYISSPLAPVEIRELPARVSFQDIPGPTWSLGPAEIEAAFVTHRGPTLGYRITDGGVTVAYIPDHEPGLGQRIERSPAEWISGLALASHADLVIHDCQYSDSEYPERVGWGHSAVADSISFARRSDVRRLAMFHHDPLRDDDAIDSLKEAASAQAGGMFESLMAAREGQTVELS